MTPDAPRAAETSTEAIRACAIGLRRYATCTSPGSWMLSVQLVWPVTSRASSLRARGLPISVVTVMMPLLGSAEAARMTARTMFWYPVQRHRLPSRPSRTSCSVGLGLSRSRSAAAMIMPGVQYPHCSACSSWKACCSGCHSPFAMPWMVVICAPSACTASTAQLFADIPFSSTVQAPQLEVSQPTGVPVRPATSRR